MKYTASSLALLLLLALTTNLALANTKQTKTTYRSTSDILKSAPESDWYFLNQNNLLYLTLSNGKQVVIELNDTFAPEHSKQLRLITKHNYWNGLSVYRVQDNYVAQFGSYDNATDKNTRDLPSVASKKLPAEFSLPIKKVKLDYTLPDKDAYSDKLGFVNNFPVAVKNGQAFIVHCYGVVGAARDNPPNSSTAQDLYAIIGQPARHLDRQITVVGRVVYGIENLSVLNRGSGAMGFYEEKDGMPVEIVSASMGSDLPKDKQLNLKSISSKSKTFHELIESRRHIQGEWFATKASGGMGLCDVRQTIELAK